MKVNDRSELNSNQLIDNTQLIYITEVFTQKLNKLESTYKLEIETLNKKIKSKINQNHLFSFHIQNLKIELIETKQTNFKLLEGQKSLEQQNQILSSIRT